MAIKRYFDGVQLHEVEVPDLPLPDVVRTNADPLAPLGLDAGPIDPAVPNLDPTAGALPPTKLPEPPPGTGEGAGVGAPSDPWTSAPPTPASGTEDQGPDDHWTKAQLADYIRDNGGEPPADSERKEAFIAKAQEVFTTKQLA